ncbi:hypothetical protein GCM10027053_23050 [Intrasporangium mesophilum]
MSATGISYASAITASYFTWTTRSSGSAESSRFGPRNPMKLCADVQGSSSSQQLHTYLMRDIQFLPDPIQRQYWPLYKDPYGCAVAFNGSANEGYYTSVTWFSESVSHNGFVQVTN